ncbi:MAG: SDR family oxidoreductase [Dehalococcoidia bacterium]
MEDFKEKVVIVTGSGGQGIGTATCLEFARRGACLVANDINASEADRIADSARQLGTRAIATYADVSKPSDCEEMVRQAVSEFEKVDVMVTVPACVELGMFMDYSLEIMHKQMDITFWGVVNSIRAVVDPMLQQGNGSIVCVGSESGKAGPARQTMYSAAKAAIMTFVKSLSREVGSGGVRVNVVNAGMTKTAPMVESGWWTPEKEERLTRDFALHRFAEPREVAEAILYLASDRASYITGETLSVTGGAA